MLENVDRLIKSPGTQRGRDFGIVLRGLYDSGYAVKWRVINAAEYGNAQRRRRVFIFAYKNATNLFKKVSDVICTGGSDGLHKWIVSDNWTATEMPENLRYFTMGNALVVPVVKKIGNRILEIP